MGLRFTPSLEQLGDRANPSTLTAEPTEEAIWDQRTLQTRQVTVVQDLLEGQQCLVFYLGGVPSAGTDLQRRNLVTLHSTDLD